MLAASVLSEHGLPVPGVRFAYYPLPEMAAKLKAGAIASWFTSRGFDQGQLRARTAPAIRILGKEGRHR